MGLDLVHFKKITALDIILNKQLSIKHPEGELLINLPKSFNSEKPLRVPKKGYKEQNIQGDFYIKIAVTNEQEMSEELKEQINKLFDTVSN